MLPKIAKTISDFFLGEPIAETEEIYQTTDGKFRISIGLFRKKSDDTVWVKFVHKSIMGESSAGIAIAVDSFQHFADFLGSAASKAECGAGIPSPLPLFARMVLAITEGISQPTLLGEYRAQGVPKVVTRLFAFKNRRSERRVVIEHKSSQDTYEVFDTEV